MANNYLTSAYPAQAMLKLWTSDDKKFEAPARGKSAPKTRQLVFVSSAAAFAAIPGYTAYTRQSPNNCQRRTWEN
jgi:3-dehydrosphinganine reductase